MRSHYIKRVQLDPVNKRFAVQSFQNVQDVPASEDSESIEVVGDFQHI
jgi:hypothetical protein